MSDLSFNIDDSVKTVEEGLGSILKPGIHNNVELVKIEYVKAEEGSKWDESLDFTFEVKIKNILKDNQGNVIPDSKGNPIVLSIPGETIKKREFFTVSKADEERQAKMLGRIKHILTKFMKPDEISITGKNFEGMCKSIIKLLKDKTDGKRLRLKVVKNGKNSQVPYYMPFLENMQEVKMTKMNISDKELQGETPSSIADLDSIDSEIDIDVD